MGAGGGGGEGEVKEEAEAGCELGLSSDTVLLKISSSSEASDLVFRSLPELPWALMAAIRADLSFSSSVYDGFFMLLGPEVDIFLRRSLPPPVWMASIRLLCRDVSLSTDLQITGLNFFTGPNRVTGGGPGVTPQSDTVTEGCGFSSDMGWAGAWVVSEELTG